MVGHYVWLSVLLSWASVSCEYEIEYVECKPGVDVLKVNEKDITFGIRNSIRLAGMGKHSGNTTIFDGLSRKHTLAYSLEIKELDMKGCRLSVEIRHKCGATVDSAGTTQSMTWNRRVAIGSLTNKDATIGFIVKVSKLPDREK